MPLFIILVLIFYIPAMALAVLALVIMIVPFYIVSTIIILRLICRFGFASRNVKVNEEVVIRHPRIAFNTRQRLL